MAVNILESKSLEAFKQTCLADCYVVISQFRHADCVDVVMILLAILFTTLPSSKTSQNMLSFTLDALSSSCCTKRSVQV